MVVDAGRRVVVELQVMPRAVTGLNFARVGWEFLLLGAVDVGILKKIAGLPTHEDPVSHIRIRRGFCSL